MQIVEQFMSIQGEGVTIGRPAYFVRFDQCNLSCTWCDSKNASRTHSPNYTVMVQEVLVPRTCQRMIITGGEPLLHEIYPFIKQLKNQAIISNNSLKYFEVETNGTLLPSVKLFQEVDQWNVSPKLKDTQKFQDHQELTLESIHLWATLAQGHKKVIFKFVVGSKEQFSEVLDIVRTHNLPTDQVYIMREGVTRDKFLEDEFNYWIIKQCQKFNFNYTTRLHILLWNRQTGV